MDSPLVSVICLCYRHEPFVEEAIMSVIRQTYRNIEIIVVDDASPDGSKRKIQEVLLAYPEIRFLPLEKNIGNCAAFNRGLSLCNGEFVVDFSTDDVMLADRIEKQVAFFSSLDASHGVVFTDVIYIDEKGNPLFKHYDYLRRKNLLKSVPTGDVYADVLGKYFISAPSMLVRREVFDALGGYDEHLAYEDFDFWVRSSRNFKYAFLDEVLTKVRKPRNSLSTFAYVPGNLQLYSTYLVCRKARELNRSRDEYKALLQRLRYELRHAVFTRNYREAHFFLGFILEINRLNSGDKLLLLLMRLKIPLAGIRRLYHRLRYG
jgi:glycosyltransferase involved in cell wall biosynthesis